MRAIWQDIRFGARMLAKHPGFTAIAVLTLALGIGANTGIFTILHQAVLQRLPVLHPEQLVLLYSPGPKQGHVSSDESGAPGDEGAESFSYPMYANLRDRNSVFTGLAAKDTFSATLTYRGNTERARADLVSGNYFETLGVTAAIGRTFEPADTAAPGSTPVVMLSNGYWKSRFGADPGVLNQGVLVNNRPMTVVGVVSAGFDGIQPGFVPEIYIPITMLPSLISSPLSLDNHKDFWIKFIGRLKPEMSRERAATGLAPLYSALLRDELPSFTGWDDAKKTEFLAKKLIVRNGARGRPQLSSGAGPQLMAFTCVLALISGVLFSVAPALRATRVELVSTLKEQSGALSSGLAHTRLRQGLVVCQVALTLLLVTVAGGFARSLFNVKHIDLGLRTAHVLQFSVAPQLNGYDQARSFGFFRTLEDRIATLPGVLTLSGAQEPLIADSDRGSNVTVEGEPPALAGTRHVMRNAVGPGHFSNLGIPLLKGREFTRADVAGSPKVAILNETMAKTFFPT